MKTYECKELGCFYRWSDEYNQLEWCPMMTDGTLDKDNWGVVDEDIVGEEIVTFEKKEMPLSVVYRKVEKLLGK